MVVMTVRNATTFMVRALECFVHQPEFWPVGSMSDDGEDYAAGGYRPAAGLSSLQLIFAPWPVFVEEAILPAEAPPLPPDEEAQIAHAVKRRRVEFATGRLCARRALARLDIDDFILLNDARRAPRWPPGVVGSLTHTGDVPGGYCAVAVARADDLLTVGLDAEKSGGLSARLWRFVLTPDERLWLAGSSPDRQGLLAKLIFSAKECFYKAQFPLTGKWLGFQDVVIALDLEAGSFEARLSVPEAGGLPFSRCSGRFLVGDDLVRTAIAVPRRGF